MVIIRAGPSFYFCLYWKVFCKEQCCLFGQAVLREWSLGCYDDMSWYPEKWEGVQTQ